MKLEFRKNDEQEISVMRVDDEGTSDYDYVEMIKTLMQTGALEKPNIVGDFSEAETNSIQNMVKHINEEVAKFYEDEEETAVDQ